MSRQPTTELIPCEYCQIICSPNQLRSHEVDIYS